MADIKHIHGKKCEIRRQGFVDAKTSGLVIYKRFSLNNKPKILGINIFILARCFLLFFFLSGRFPCYSHSLQTGFEILGRLR